MRPHGGRVSGKFFYFEAITGSKAMLLCLT